MEEIWKDIDGYEGKYQISNNGAVCSLEYHNTKGIKRKGFLKPAKDSKGYLRCALSKENKLRTFKIHRLVAQAFIPNPLNLPQVNHIDGDKTNNCVSNLEWCDNSYNQRHAYSNGLNPKHVGHRVGVQLTNIKNGEVLVFDQIKKACNFLSICRDYLRQLSNLGITEYNGYKFEFIC